MITERRSSTEDILFRVRAADPVAEHLLPDRTDAQIEVDLAKICGGALHETTPRPQPRARRPRQLLGAAAAVTLIAGGLIASPYGLDMGGSRDGSSLRVVRAGQSAEAAQLLEQAARVTPTDPPTRPGQYWEVTSKAVQHSPGSSQDPAEIAWSRVQRVDYYAVDGEQPTYVRQLTETREGGRWRKSPTILMRSESAPNGHRGSWDEPSVAFMADLPRETAPLRADLYAAVEGRGNSSDGEALNFIAAALRSELAPADLRASMFRVLATIPGVEVTSRIATIDGRQGVGFGRLETNNGMRREIIIDPATGTLIGDREVVPQDVTDDNGVHLPAGLVTWEQSATRRVVDSVPSEIRRSAQVATSNG